LIQYGYSIVGVLFANLLFKVIVVLLFFIKGDSPFFGKQSTSPLPTSVRKRVYQYALNYYVYALMLYVLGKGADIFIIGSMVADSRQAAFYTIAFNFAFFASSFFELALQGGFILPFISEVYHLGNKENLKKVYTGLFEFIYLFTIPISVGGLILSTDLINVLFGKENQEAAPLLSLFFVHFAVVKIGVLNANFMLAMDQQSQLIRSRLIFGGLNVIINLLLVQNYQAWGVVLGTLITGFLNSVYESWRVHHLVQPRYSIMFSIKIVIASTIMGGSLVLLSQITFVFVGLKICLSIGIGGLIYTALLIYLKPISPENLEIIQKSSMPFKQQLFRLLSKPR